MIIKNETNWNTEDLRKLFSECCSRMGIENSHRVVTVKNERGHGLQSGGHAYLNSNLITILLPMKVWQVGIDGQRTEMKIESLNPVELAQTFMHEAGHNEGLQHEDMLNPSELDADWATPFVINRAKKEAVPKVDYPNLRYQKILKSINVKESKVKRLENALEKLYRRKSYYEKKLNA